LAEGEIEGNLSSSKTESHHLLVHCSLAGAPSEAELRSVCALGSCNREEKDGYKSTSGDALIETDRGWRKAITGMGLTGMCHTYYFPIIPPDTPNPTSVLLTQGKRGAFSRDKIKVKPLHGRGT